MDKRNIFQLNKDIKNGLKTAENYNTGLVGEALIVSAYKQMPLKDLEKLRFILNEIIKRKKEIIRIQNDAGNVQKAINQELPKPAK